MANSRYSADVVAVSPAVALSRLPDDLTDNGLPRWLEATLGIAVEVLPRWQLGIDVDGPLDAVVLARAGMALGGDPDAAGERLRRALDDVASVAVNPHAELVVAGRSSARTLAWLERATASRTRAIIEERGMRSVGGGGERPAGQRPPRSLLGAALDRDGPESFGTQLAELCDAAVVDSRVLMAHRFGPDEPSWPPPEDRFASDLLLHERIEDPWLKALTRSAHEAEIPIVLGGHTLVGPGLRLALRRR
jgi:hypothetical protein